jgi:hypothetical protein
MLLANPFDLQLECASLVIRVGGQTLRLIENGARCEIEPKDIDAETRFLSPSASRTTNELFSPLLEDLRYETGVFNPWRTVESI